MRITLLRVLNSLGTWKDRATHPSLSQLTFGQLRVSNRWRDSWLAQRNCNSPCSPNTYAGPQASPETAPATSTRSIPLAASVFYLPTVLCSQGTAERGSWAATDLYIGGLSKYVNISSYLHSQTEEDDGVLRRSLFATKCWTPCSSPRQQGASPHEWRHSSHPPLATF